MARVNVETRALAERRLEVLMKTLRWRKREALGTLVLLWHDSQEQLISHATKRQVMDWLDAKNDQEAEKILNALVRSGYVDAEPNDIFHIRGNKKHVEAFLDLKVAQIKGGLASAESRKNKKLAQVPLPIDLNTPSSATEVNAKQSNAEQSNSIQNNSIQDNKKKEIKPRSAQAAAPKSPAKSAPLWAVYKEEFIKKWRKDPPPPDATTYSQLCVLLRNFGEEQSKDVIRHYFKLNDSYYIQNFHPIALLVKQRHKICSSMSTGISMTKATVQRFEKTVQFQESLQAIEKGEM